MTSAGALAADPGPAVRDAARGRRHARAAPRGPRRRDRRGRLGRRSSRRSRRSRPGRASVRFAVNGEYADPTTSPGRRRRARLHPAGERRRGRRAAARILEIRAEPFGPRPRRRRSRTASRRTRTGAWSRSSAGPGSRPGRRRPGQEAEAARHAGRGRRRARVRGASSRWRCACSARSPTRSRRGSACRAAGDRPPDRRRAAGRRVAPRRRRRAATADAAFAAARYAIDETKARAPIWKAERFADGHVWVGDVARTLPSRRGRRPSRAALSRRILPPCSCSATAATSRTSSPGPPTSRSAWGGDRGRSPRRAGAGDPAPVRRDRARPRRAARSRPRSSTATSARTRGASAAASRSRSRWRMAEYDLRAAGARAGGRGRQRGPGARGGAPRRARPSRRRRGRRHGARAGGDGPHRREPHRPPRAAGGARRPAAAVDRDRASPRRRSSTPSTRRAGRDRRGRRARPRGRAAQPRARGPDGPASARRRGAGRRRPSSRGGLDAFDPSGAAGPDRRAARAAVLRRFVDEAGARRRGYVRIDDRRAGARRAGPGGRRRVRADRPRRSPTRCARSSPAASTPTARSPTTCSPTGCWPARGPSPRPGRAADRRPDLAAGVPSDAATRAGRALALQLLAVALARRDGLPADAVVVGAFPDWLVDEPDAPARAAAEVALRRALLPGPPARVRRAAPPPTTGRAHVARARRAPSCPTRATAGGRSPAGSTAADAAARRAGRRGSPRACARSRVTPRPHGDRGSTTPRGAVAAAATLRGARGGRLDHARRRAAGHPSAGSARTRRRADRGLRPARDRRSGRG